MGNNEECISFSIQYFLCLQIQGVQEMQWDWNGFEVKVVENSSLLFGDKGKIQLIFLKKYLVKFIKNVRIL